MEYTCKHGVHVCAECDVERVDRKGRQHYCVVETWFRCTRDDLQRQRGRDPEDLKRISRLFNKTGDL